jgi:hypothetical protein
MDLNVRAFRTVQAALSEPLTPTKRRHVEGSRRGGKLGGASRAKTLTAERRREIAKKANSVRWGKNPST